MDPLSLMLALGSGTLGKLQDFGLGIGSGFVSSAIQHNYQEKNLKNSTHEQRKLMHLQYLYQKAYDQNRPTWQRQGLEKAGYNAMLPFLGNGGGLNSGVVSAPSSPSGAPSGIPNLGSFQASSAISNYISLKELQLKEKQLDSQLRLLHAQENKVKAETKTIKTKLPNQVSGNAVSNYLFGDGSGVDALKGFFHSGLSDIINQSVPWAVSGYLLKKLYDRNNGPKGGQGGGSGTKSSPDGSLTAKDVIKEHPEIWLSFLRAAAVSGAKDGLKGSFKNSMRILPIVVAPASAGALMRGGSIGAKLRPIFY